MRRLRWFQTVSSRAKEFVDLHDQVQVRVLPPNDIRHAHEVKTSVDLLDSLESFLSTFQNDLSSVSGQISDLQSRSRDIESRLKSRRVRLFSLSFSKNPASRLGSPERCLPLAAENRKAAGQPDFWHDASTDSHHHDT